MEECVYKLRQHTERTRAGLQVAPRKKKKTGKWKKGLDHIQGRKLPPNKPYNKKQGLRYRTFSPKQGTKDKATAGAGLPKGRGVEGGRSNAIPVLILYIVYTQILTNLTTQKLRKLTLKHILTLFLLTSPPNHLTVQLPQTLGEIPLGRRGWVREDMAAEGKETLQ